MKKSPGLFDNDLVYYKSDWHGYYSLFIELCPSDSQVLEIGCGRGGLLEYLKKIKNCQVLGVDISSEAVDICKKKGIPALICDAEKDIIPGKYDVIILSAVLEHLKDPLNILKKIKNNCKKGGNVIIGVPNFSHIIARFLYLFGKNVKRYGDDQIARRKGIQPPGHINFFNKPTLLYLFEKADYKILEWRYYESTALFGLYKINHPLFSVFIAVKVTPR